MYRRKSSINNFIVTATRNSNILSTKSAKNSAKQYGIAYSIELLYNHRWLLLVQLLTLSRMCNCYRYAVSYSSQHDEIQFQVIERQDIS